MFDEMQADLQFLNDVLQTYRKEPLSAVEMKAVLFYAVRYRLWHMPEATSPQFDDNYSRFQILLSIINELE